MRRNSEQSVQGRLVLLPGELLDGQLVGCLVVAGIGRQAALQLCAVGQVGSLAQEGQLRAGAGQGLLVLVALHRVEDGLRLFQFAALGQAAA